MCTMGVNLRTRGIRLVGFFLYGNGGILLKKRQNKTKYDETVKYQQNSIMLTDIIVANKEG